jgi:hypothetical protein
VPGEAKEVVALGGGEVKALGDRGDHLLGWLWAAFLFESGVVVGRHVA